MGAVGNMFATPKIPVRMRRKSLRGTVTNANYYYCRYLKKKIHVKQRAMPDIVTNEYNGNIEPNKGVNTDN